MAGVSNTLSTRPVVWFLEPFYVAADFGMYLNQRVNSGPQDIEQEFMRVPALRHALTLQLLPAARSL